MLSNYFAKIIAACLGKSPYMMPESHLPDADCKKCYYTTLPHEGGHCFMFYERPGDKCGQFKERRKSPCDSQPK